MGLLLVFSLLLTLAACEDHSEAMQEMVARQRRTIARIDEIKATAVKDEQGKVSPAEYGRLLGEVAEATGSYRTLKDFQELLNAYVATLTEPQDPEEVLMDLGMGAFSRILMDAFNRDMHKSLKRDL